jgi:hypothetical protein
VSAIVAKVKAARAQVQAIVGTVLDPAWTPPRRGLPPGGEAVQ